MYLNMPTFYVQLTFLLHGGPVRKLLVYPKWRGLIFALS